MRLSELIKRLFIHYFLIFSGSIISAMIYCRFFYPDFSMGLVELDGMMLLALAGDLPLCVFYSKKELTTKQYRIRAVIHVIILEIVMLYGLSRFGAYESFGEGAALFFLILAVYLVIKLISYMIDVKTADYINERLKEMNSEDH